MEYPDNFHEIHCRVLNQLNLSPFFMRLKLHREGREEKRENVEAAPSWRHKLQNLILTFAKLFFPSTTGINFTIVLSQILKCYLLKKCQTFFLCWRSCFGLSLFVSHSSCLWWLWHWGFRQLTSDAKALPVTKLKVTMLATKWRQRGSLMLPSKVFFLSSFRTALWNWSLGLK